MHFGSRQKHERLVVDGDGGRVAAVDVQTTVGVGGGGVSGRGGDGGGSGCGIGDDRHSDVTSNAFEDDAGVTKFVMFFLAVGKAVGCQRMSIIKLQ